ncbi:MAG: class I SAM-dependent methyltransferase [Woeseiaceae bacterium]
MKKFVIPCAVALSLVACSKSEPEPAATAEPAAVVQAAEEMAAPTQLSLVEILDNQPEAMQARYGYRHPAETLQFFGIEPGMTVVEGLPGGGWYSKILIPLLGAEGTLVGVDYSASLFPLFGFFSDEALEKKKTWTTDWVAGAQEWRGDNAAEVKAFVFGSMPESFAGTADAVVMIRAMHNLNRFEDEGGFRTEALENMFAVLKPGGILGIVQHQAAADMPDEWADGSNGYLKQEDLVAHVEAAGFSFVDSSDINVNPADQPTTDDVVWRLPPTLATSREDDALRAEMLAIGESNRMTLKFRKPE